MAERRVLVNVLYGSGGGGGGGSNPPTWPPDDGVNIEDYGGSGDDSTDNYSPLMAAISAAAGRPVYIPVGNYVFSASTVNIPSGTTIVGESTYNTYLKTRIRYNSSSSFSYFKCGMPGNSAAVNANNAQYTSFDHVRFRGGGSTSDPWGDGAPVLNIGGLNDCNNITFSYCDIECNMGTIDSSLSYLYNDISIYSWTALVQNIYFTNCNIGVSNGLRTGSPRMGVECYTASVEDGAPATPPGWYNIIFSGTTVEVCDAHGIDFSDSYERQSSGVLVENCLIKGGGAAYTNWGSSVDFELTQGFIFRNNTVYRGWEKAFQMWNHGDPYPGPNGVITGNTFNTAYDNGITPEYGYTEEYQLDLWGTNTYSGNTWVTP